MTIRPATLADVPRLVAMGQRFRAETAYRDLIAENPAQMATTATRLIDGPDSVVLVADAGEAVVGMIGLVIYPHHWSAERVCGEAMWWIEPDARGLGLQLLTAAERWAAEAGAIGIQLIAPDARVGVLYQRRGYVPIETAYYKAVTPALTGLRVVDDVLPNLEAARTAALQQPFGDVETAPGVVWHGIAAPADDTLTAWITARYPSLTPTLSFLRRSPEGQEEPNFIHTDRDMGEWTAILYLTRAPVPEDGTTFWRWTETGQIQSTATEGAPLLAEWLAWRDRAQWTPWTTVPARPNRVVLFPAAYFHSRAIEANVGEADDARLIQVVFGRGVFPPAGA